MYSASISEILSGKLDNLQQSKISDLYTSRQWLVSRSGCILDLCGSMINNSAGFHHLEILI